MSCIKDKEATWLFITSEGEPEKVISLPRVGFARII